MKQCHNCQYNNMGDDHCLDCQMPESYYMPNVYFDESRETSSLKQDDMPMRATNMPQDLEDIFKFKILDIFSLSCTELLCLQAILQNKTLAEFSRSIEQFSRNIQTFSRHRAFQTRNAILAKLPWLADALLTQGQRKKLTVNSNRRKVQKQPSTKLQKAFNPPLVQTFELIFQIMSHEVMFRNFVMALEKSRKVKNVKKQ